MNSFSWWVSFLATWLECVIIPVTIILISLRLSLIVILQTWSHYSVQILRGICQIYLLLFWLLCIFPLFYKSLQTMLCLCFSQTLLFWPVSIGYYFSFWNMAITKYPWLVLTPPSINVIFINIYLLVWETVRIA